jgi:hypothetical protein
MVKVGEKTKRERRNERKKEELLRRKRKIDSQIKSFRQRGKSDDSPKLQKLEAEKVQVVRWLMYLNGSGSRLGLPARRFPGSSKRKSKKQRHPDLPFGGGYSDRGPEWLRNWR